MAKALSVRQPWAWAVARGHKDVENRSWTTTYRGKLLVHASMRVDLRACESALIREAGWSADDPLAAIGAIVAVVEIHEVCAASIEADDVRCACGAWAAPGHYHWQLVAQRPLHHPVLATGRLGLWQPSDELLAAVDAAIVGE